MHTRTILLSNEKMIQPIIIMSLLIALSAQVAIPIGPVPITLQTMLIGLLGFLLPRRVAFFALLAYLIEGAAGFPVFAGGEAGLLVLLGPKGGYLLAFPLMVLLINALYAQPQLQGKWGIVLIALVANLFVLCIGTLYLSHFIGLSQAIVWGFRPFVLIECLKALLVGALVIGCRRRG